MKLETEKAFLRSLRRRSDAELQKVALGMQEAAGSFGQPHSHSGVGIRRLGRNLFECRVGLDPRPRNPDIRVFRKSRRHSDIPAKVTIGRQPQRRRPSRICSRPFAPSTRARSCSSHQRRLFCLRPIATESLLIAHASKSGRSLAW
jgi:hypothetical protein